MAPHSRTPAWRIPWMEGPGGLQSMGSLRVGHDWATSLSLFTFLHWRRKWQPTPVFLPGESQGRGSLVGAVYGVAQSWTQLKRPSSRMLSLKMFRMEWTPMWLEGLRVDLLDGRNEPDNRFEGFSSSVVNIKHHSHLPSLFIYKDKFTLLLGRLHLTISRDDFAHCFSHLCISAVLFSVSFPFI